MTSINKQSFADAVNSDPEFRIQGRFWSGAIRVGIDNEGILIRIVNGQIVTIEDATLFDSFDIEIAGPTAEWEKFLRENPQPFYHDIFAAGLHHDIRWGGNLEMWFAYYGAIRKMFELMRGHVLVETQ